MTTITCDRCRGRGKVTRIDVDIRTIVDCPACQGGGKLFPEPPWIECEMCGCGVSPQSAVYGMPIHGDCWVRLTPAQQEKMNANLKE